MISTRGRYALRVMIDLAEHEKGSISHLRISLPVRSFPRNTWK